MIEELYMRSHPTTVHIPLECQPKFLYLFFSGYFASQIIRSRYGVFKLKICYPTFYKNPRLGRFDYSAERIYDE